MPHHEEIHNAKRFEEALAQILEVDIVPIFGGIHRINEILAERGIENPLTPNAIMELGIVLGAVQLMQATAPKRKDGGHADPSR